MRIGSVLLVLLVALVALGFFLADAMHLREDITSQQIEIDELKSSIQKSKQERQKALAALQTVEQEKQIALANLQNVSQNLLSCRQEVEQANQQVAQLSRENSFLQEQALSPGRVSQSSLAATPVKPATPAEPTTQLHLVALIAVAFGSAVLFAPKAWRKKNFTERREARVGSYVYLTGQEIHELIQRRRTAIQDCSRN